MRWLTWCGVLLVTVVVTVVTAGKGATPGYYLPQFIKMPSDTLKRREVHTTHSIKEENGDIAVKEENVKGEKEQEKEGTKGKGDATLVKEEKENTKQTGGGRKEVIEMEKKKQTLEQMKGEPMGMKYDTGEGKEKAEGNNKLKSYQLLGEYLLPDKSKCGKRARKSYRVFFGEDAPLNAYPWMALLGYRNPDKPHWLCGGSLINDRYVLSAGHCVHPESIRKSRIGQLLKVRLGEHDLSKKIDCPQDYIDAKECAPSPLDFKPESITIHPDYSPTLLINDISLIRLGKPVTFTHAIRPVCLPQSDLDVSEFLGYRDAVVAGWGSTENTLQSKILQRAPIPYQKRAACEVEYLSYLGEGQLCFGGRNRQDSCFGDSGGPVMQSKAGTGQYTQLGIVSYGKKICGTVGVPAVYTNVAHYRSWILQCLKP